MNKYNKFCCQFGHKKLKLLQKQIVENIIDNSTDTLAILSTGYGKSICYQLPFLALKKQYCVIVISPLIALMEDQVTNLNEKNIEAIALNSNMTNKVRQTEINKILKGINKIIYMSPEFTMSHKNFITDLYNEERILLFAIDEAHCISSWGNEFRADYRNLSCLKKDYPEIPILALTATATPKVRLDIATNLGFTEYQEYVSSFDRPNIYIECTPQSNDPINDFKQLVKNYRNIQTIVYVRTRDTTDIIASVLHELNINARAYHAGLAKEDRQAIFNEFVTGQCKWIVATVALGMGIDQNIGLIIHYGSPGDMETYYQEIGRAGRNGEEAMCILFYGKNDMRVNRILLKEITDLTHRTHRELQITSMEAYIRTNKCRRKILLKYFNEDYAYDCCEYCDNCCNEQNIDEDEEVQHALQYPMFIFRYFLFKTSINAGLTKIIDILMGRGGKKTKDYIKTPFYSLGKRYDDRMWRLTYEVCVLNGYITNKTIPNGFGTVIECSQKLIQWVNDKSKEIKSINRYEYDNFLTIAYNLQEKFEFNDGKNILRSHNKRTFSQVENLKLEHEES